ncbi:S-adenosylmethionine mitochondrial carrier protein-like [Eriocheir sinensis]|uniref:S-adenosylmethionine mitochondrial carrier protein-like n=1 Tax=Eriocheir sinensis TaxID=95602 RepID=UPI0021C62938|nr:S-adenosylmethionine mitochondrial carrier protein-like [Eriocheir sinensis]XP_050727529.1 S-adenosylmethionine mitochondrial carrier protein-like [Eriocheir sinensis]XP_050727531.1 S-adenosylmethionine mitochondrial carrier protein-like [Eriocheir sinensis]XP_050727532.1 S-adenosylmethionine mitochondrial carrier protein-like [Eriocheir sinensis]XP_050727533.1 S-adenosylmethionine mitochondrial carrier protein-like [Eriocheir sinensis]XP_050727534.1 S-adenosylmethionine mitochondrial carri
MSCEEPSFATSLMAGGVAGTAVDVALFPLDTLKTRLQSEAGFRASGGFRGIYSGLGPAALASAPNAALFFCTYESMKKLLGSHVPSSYLPGVHMAAASAGEVVSCIIRVPMEVVKQRRQAQLSHSSIQIVRDVMRKEGPVGLFRGYASTVMREIPFSLIQFPVWELLKKTWSEKQGHYVDSWQASLCGAFAGGLSAALTTPLDVAKTRIMLAHHESITAKGNIKTVLRTVYKQQGLSGLFAGVVPRTLWISVGGAVFFGVYEKAKLLFT